MPENFKIVVVGGGNAGLSLAAQLLLKDASLSVAIIEPSEKHYYQPAWTLVGAGVYDIKKTERLEKDFIPKKATWIKDAVVAFEPEHNKVVCKSGKEISYEILVVCPGIQLDWDKIAGLKENLGKNNVSSNYSFDYAPYTWEMIKNFKGGVAVFTNPPTPIKCGGAPHKIMYLACDYWAKNGVMEKTEVHYVSGAGVIFGVPEYAATLKEILARHNIKTHFGAIVKSIDGGKREITFEAKTDSIKEIQSQTQFAACFGMEPAADSPTTLVNLKFDFCHAVPPQSAPDFIKKSPLADANSPYGYVEVDKHTFRHTRYPNVFSLGDASSAPCSKTGAAIRKQVPVVVSHILAQLNKSTSTASYDGQSACPIPTQYGKLMLAEFDYSNKPKMTFPFDQAKPRRSMWVLKKYILPWLYWNKILSGKA
ncbi:MAG: NAD(P)/FAD-dependent oxidoreductase [Sphingobacteriales bacterium]|nr:NAD(P)/FAD-dependent oxidoreductase [Sphingobacteriales bacterium]